MVFFQQKKEIYLAHLNIHIKRPNNSAHILIWQTVSGTEYTDKSICESFDGSVSIKSFHKTELNQSNRENE